MSKTKQYGATIADAGDGVMDADKINELELKRAWDEWEYEKLSNEIDNKTLQELRQENEKLLARIEQQNKEILKLINEIKELL